MKIAELKKGMRVYPIFKSIEGPLGKSKEWAAAVAAKVFSLVIVKVVADKNQKPYFVCAMKSTALVGDKFHAGDLRLGSRPVVSKGKFTKPAAKKVAAKPVAKKVAAKPAAKNDPTSAEHKDLQKHSAQLVIDRPTPVDPKKD